MYYLLAHAEIWCVPDELQNLANPPLVVPFLVSLLLTPCTTTDDYRTHTSCITEAERYEKSVYRPNNNTGKGRKRNPQEEWMDLIARAASNVASSSSSPSSSSSSSNTILLQHQLKTLAGLGNVPRKEKQFRNFAANSLNLGGNKHQMDALDQVWAYLNAMRNAENDVRKKQEAKDKEAAEERKRNEMEEREKNKTNDIDSDDDDDDDSKNNCDISVVVDKPVPQLLSSKVVRKAVKKILKKENKCIKIKLLRSKLCDALGLDNKSSLQKKQLKKMLQKELGGAAQDSKIKVDGKMVQLL